MAPLETNFSASAINMLEQIDESFYKLLYKIALDIARERESSVVESQDVVFALRKVAKVLLDTRMDGTDPKPIPSEHLPDITDSRGV